MHAQDIFSKQDLEKCRNAIVSAKLSSVPEIVLELQKEVQKENPDMSHIADLVANDVVTSGHVIQIVNSPFMGLKAKVLSIQHATMLLGISKFKSVILSAALKRVVKGDSPFHRTFWDESNAIAMLSSEIARLTYLEPEIAPENAYLAGLFHNAGTLVLEKIDQDYQNSYKNSYSQAISIVELEQQQYGLDHVITGYALAHVWQLPDEVLKAIAYHHKKDIDTIEDNGVKNLTAVLQLAQVLYYRAKHPELEEEKSNQELDILQLQAIKVLKLEAFEKEDIKQYMADNFENCALPNL